MTKKILGILGGMGPRATANFYTQLVNYTQADKDWDHLHVIIDSDVHIPSRTRSILYGEESPVKGIRKACFKLMEMGCEYIAVPCNSAHYFYDEVVINNDIPWVNMLEVISTELKIFNKVFITGGYVTIVNKIYDKHLNNTVYLENNDFIFDMIEKIKTKKDCSLEKHIFYKTIKDMNIDCVLLGCTELSILIDERSCNGISIIDGNIVYINKLIKMGGAKTYE